MDVTLDCDGGRVRARKVVLATYSPFSQFQYSLVAGLENGREVSTLKQWICGIHCTIVFFCHVRFQWHRACSIRGCETDAIFSFKFYVFDFIFIFSDSLLFYIRMGFGTINLTPALTQSSRVG